VHRGATGIIDCVNGQVAGGGGTSTITLKMFAPDTPGLFTNQVNVDPDNTIPEGDEFNNQATEDTTVVNGGTGSFNDLGLSFQPTPASTNATTAAGIDHLPSRCLQLRHRCRHECRGARHPAGRRVLRVGRR
jgi:hypothetical protein